MIKDLKNENLLLFLALVLFKNIALSKPTPYFDSTAPGKEVQVFAKGIVSDGAPAISKENDVIL